MKKYKTLLFDMDGTIADTDPLILEAMNFLYDKYRNGNRTPESEIIYFSGPPIRDTLKKEFPDKDINFMFEEFHKKSSTLYATHVFAYPNSKEVLLELKKDGYQLGIVTNKLHHLAEYALKCIDLDNIFEFIVGFDDVDHPKPHQEGILKAIDYFKSNKNDTLYIGDNKSDLLTANNAGVDCCLVSWGPRVLPKELNPTFKISSYIDLKEKLYGKSL